MNLWRVPLTPTLSPQAGEGEVVRRFNLNSSRSSVPTYSTYVGLTGKISARQKLRKALRNRKGTFGRRQSDRLSQMFTSCSRDQLERARGNAYMEPRVRSPIGRTTADGKKKRPGPHTFAFPSIVRTD